MTSLLGSITADVHDVSTAFDRLNAKLLALGPAGDWETFTKVLVIGAETDAAPEVFTDAPRRAITFGKIE